MHIVERSPKTSWLSFVAFRIAICLSIGAAFIGMRELQAQGERVGDNSKAHDQVKKLLDTQVESWNKGDLDGFMLGYWKSDELTFFADNTVEKGYEALNQRYFKKYKADGKEMGKLTFSEVDIKLVSTTFVVVRGRWKVEKTTETRDGLYTLWMEKKPEGWRIIHDHSSANELPKK